jgi:hypothetical protein
MPIKKLTDECFAAIPGLLEAGHDKQQIAALFGVTAATLQVRCSQKKISLRPIRPRSFRNAAKSLRVGVEVVRLFEDEAKVFGMSAHDLAKAALTVIAKDNLFDAVLDWRE